MGYERLVTPDPFGGLTPRAGNRGVRTTNTIGSRTFDQIQPQTRPPALKEKYSKGSIFYANYLLSKWDKACYLKASRASDAYLLCFNRKIFRKFKTYFKKINLEREIEFIEKIPLFAPLYGKERRT